MPTPREKFQELLLKLFQFDCADLDFGIYRIMNHKRDVIKRFIEKDLLNAVSEQLEKGALAEEAHSAERLAEVSEQLKETLGAEALDPEGTLDAKYANTPIGKEYLQLRASSAKSKNRPELESQIFNHLYAFFSRYYDDGDFMSLRRYSKREKYAIPYNGEEVYLHWANSDQYYIKTGENFTDYSYTHGKWTVRFKLRNAEVEQDNVKGARRFFVPEANDPTIDPGRREITILFGYRPLTAEEEKRFGKTKVQDAILREAIPKILNAARSNTDTLAALAHEKRRDADGDPVSLLDHHVRIYARKNSTDFFVHRSLEGFLERELDFYIKNEVLNLDELQTGGEPRSEGWFQILIAIKSIGRKIITFVAQIENFQKRLFEKTKFVIETNYCVTVDRIPEELLSIVASNKKQIGEWKRLFGIDGIKGNLAEPGFSQPLPLEFLKAYDKLLVDTVFFDRDFYDRLIQSLEIDVACEGLLIHSDNFQALRLLKKTFHEKVKCEYIDPPYNTSASSIPYKNNYKHSSWGTLMRDRLEVMKHLLSEDGVIFVSIDKNERMILEFALDYVFGQANKVEELIWVQNTNDGTSPTYSTNHEYVEVYAKQLETVELDRRMFREPKPGYDEVKALVDEMNPQYPSLVKVEEALGKLYEEHRREYKESIEADGLNYAREARNDPWRGLYAYQWAEYRDADGKYVTEKNAKRAEAILWVYTESDWTIMSSETKQSSTINDPNHKNYRFYDIPHPKTGRPCKPSSRGWKGTRFVDPEHPERISCESLLADHRLAFGADETKVPRQKRFLHEVETNVSKSVFSDYSDGEKELTAMFGQAGLFLAPKHSRFVARFLNQAAAVDGIVLDCFGGSGSTAHAVISLNREDQGKRRYILAEVGKHFDTLLKPRVQKALYSPTWKDGKPTSTNHGVSQCFKYIRLESYEDALDNINFKEPDSDLLKPDDYVLRYMLDFETKNSSTFLSVAELDSPFDYKLYRHGKDDPLPVDLPETFNYLIGLHVRTRRVHDNKGTRYLVYRGKSKERETVVIWRTTRGWEQKEFEADCKFIEKQKLTEGAEDVFVNTDSFAPSARSLDPVFKHLMFDEE